MLSDALYCLLLRHPTKCAVDNFSMTQIYDAVPDMTTISLLALLYFFPTSLPVFEFEWMGKLLVDVNETTTVKHHADVVGSIYFRNRDP